MSLPPDELSKYLNLGYETILNGLQSYSSKKEEARGFALSSHGKNPGNVPVLFSINYDPKDKDLFEITEEYTDFKGEKEFLFNDGLTFRVIKVNNVSDEE